MSATPRASLRKQVSALQAPEDAGIQADFLIRHTQVEVAATFPPFYEAKPSGLTSPSRRNDYPLHSCKLGTRRTSHRTPSRDCRFPRSPSGQLVDKTVANLVANTGQI